MNVTNLMKIQSMWKDFSSRHPKFAMFLKNAGENGVTEDTVIDIQIHYPDGKNLMTNIKVSREDLPLIDTIRSAK